MDTPLAGPKLAAARLLFFRMYKYTPNDDQMPGDRMLSRFFRELANRTTKLFDLTKVTTIEDEADNEKIHKQVGNGFQYTMEHNKPKRRALRTVETYLDALWIHILALAIVGAERVTPQPTNADGTLRIETQFDPPHEFVVIPFSTLPDANPRPNWSPTETNC